MSKFQIQYSELFSAAICFYGIVTFLLASFNGDVKQCYEAWMALGVSELIDIRLELLKTRLGMKND